jgi:N-acetylmuramoyl-L-alanine amidase
VRRAVTLLVLAVLAIGLWAGETRHGDGTPAPRAEPALAAPAPAAPSAPGSVLVGRSAQGRPIRAVRVGSARAHVKLLVIGSIHGNENAGRQVVARLRHVRPPRGTALWLIDTVNPDGAAAGSRQNSRGVDLNRNFPDDWRAAGRPFDTYHSGSAAGSEPETQAISRFIARERPRVTLWYHQALRIVVRSDGDPFLERLYSRRGRLPRRAIGPYHGTATGWQNHHFRGDTAFVVELPAGRLPASGVARHAGAALALARAVAPQRVVNRPIPFGARRKQEMRAYALRHYGIDDYRLRRPRVIVEHYTATDSLAPVLSTFANDAPDVELGELPGVCSHYVIDRDGTVYGLVPTTIMCRHTVGLNWTAIGIEHVGQSDGQVLGDRAQVRASLRLTRSLQGRYGIRTRNVIGHAESLSSPYHRERVARLRTQTHGDMARAAMRDYRRRLNSLPAPASMR